MSFSVTSNSDMSVNLNNDYTNSPSELLDQYENIKNKLNQNIQDYNKLNLNNFNNSYYGEKNRLYMIISNDINKLDIIKNKLLNSNSIISNKEQIIYVWKQINILYNQLKEEHNKILINYNTNKAQKELMNIEVNSNSIKYTGIIILNLIVVYYLIKNIKN